MSRMLRAAFVISRRDYVATVWSRTFLLFLIGPLLPVLFGGTFGALTAHEDEPRPSAVFVAMGHADATEILTARDRLTDRLGRDALPRLTLKRDGKDQAALGGTLDRPTLAAPGEAINDLSDRLALIVDQARAARQAGAEFPPPVRLSLHATSAAPHAEGADPVDVARGGQFVLFFLTMLLAGMTVSNLVEEKSSKVIELLAAAVPVDAIFLGKLVGMLAVSLTGIAFWTTAGVIGAGLLPPSLALATPAIGWPLYIGLGIVYFSALYLLTGAVYLGVGAQAATVREVQVLSMPLTMAQLLIFGLGSVTARHPDSPLGLFAAMLPWTSPFAMMARGALDPRLWTHALAIVWQIVSLAITIRIAARLFRRNVLKSGRGSSPQP